MILSIGSLQIPETLSGNVELSNSDSRRRTVSGRLITKLSPKEKWKVTLNYGGNAIPPELRKALYVMCREMRASPAMVAFVSPYDSLTYAVPMKCVQPFPPKIAHAQNGLYFGCGAVFEEV